MVQAGTVHSIVISPGPGTPNNSNDIGVCLDVLRQLPDVPILGICLGHQALALAHGASVVAAPQPVHGRLSRLQHSGHALFQDIPSGDGFEVVRYHSLLVDERSLPGCLEPLCWTTGGHAAVKLARDAPPTTATATATAAVEPRAAAPTSAGAPAFAIPDSAAAEEEEEEEPGGPGRPNPRAQTTQPPPQQRQQQQEQQEQQQAVLEGGCLLMGLAHRSRPHYGVQFHPESVATRYGIALLRNFRDLAAAHIQRTAGPAAALLPPPRHVVDLVGPPGRLPDLPPWPSPEHQRGSTLRLLWSRLGGLLPRLPGGTQTVFEQLYGWADDTFWLDSAAADRGRFSYMGGRGGPLWRKLTYKLPPPPATPQPRPQPQSGSQAQLRPEQQQQQQPAQQPLDTSAADPDSGAASTRNTAGAGTSTSSCGPASTAGASFSGSTAGGAAGPPGTAGGGGALTVETADGRVARVAAPHGFLGHLQELLAARRLRVEAEAAAALPFNFWGGLVGYLGYELKAECGGANTHASTCPDAVMYLADRLLAADHATGDVYLLALYDSAGCGGDGDGEGEEEGRGNGDGGGGGGDGEEAAAGRPGHREEWREDGGAAPEQKAGAQAWLRATQRALEVAVPEAEVGAAGPEAGALGVAAPASAAAASSSPSPSSQRSPPQSCCSTRQGAGSAAPPSEEPLTSSGSSSGARQRCGGGGAAEGGLEPAAAAAAAVAAAGAGGAYCCPAACTEPAAAGGGLQGPSPQTSSNCGQQQQQQQPPEAQPCATALSSSSSSSLSPAAAAAAAEVVPFTLAHGRTAYLRNIGACHAALHAGESYEVCLTTALTRPAAPSPPQLYRTLRRLNPAPYAAWLQCGAAGPTICCSSPERFLRGDRGGLLEARPIKGTAARVAADPAADAAAAAELAASEKERAENLMIVDLLRNDLGRVCQVGSVHVPGLMDIESYATVHQMVSTVRGVRRAGTSIVDCIRAAFPGGSMTGAPKVRTMQIIDSLENRARGVYSGSIGFISLNDTFDLNIVIRTAVIEQSTSPPTAPGPAAAACSGLTGAQTQSQRDQAGDPQRRAMTMMSIGAGGAIVVQSQPEAEYEEMRLKARALLRAVGLCEGRDGPVPVVCE